MPKLPEKVVVKGEADVSSSVRSYLASERITNWRNTVGSGVQPSGHYVTYGLAEGSADLIACVPTMLTCPSCGFELPPIGRFVGIETKRSAGGKKGTDQILWHRVVRMAHGVVDFARSADEARNIIEKARREW
jgi:hypothetical protein